MDIAAAMVNTLNPIISTGQALGTPSAAISLSMRFTEIREKTNQLIANVKNKNNPINITIPSCVIMENSNSRYKETQTSSYRLYLPIHLQNIQQQHCLEIVSAKQPTPTGQLRLVLFEQPTMYH